MCRVSFGRLRRVDEFVRLQTLLRIEQETERTERIKAEREFIVEQARACFSLITCTRGLRRRAGRAAVAGSRDAQKDTVAEGSCFAGCRSGLMPRAASGLCCDHD